MVGADSVIGFPLDTAVLEYDLAGQVNKGKADHSDGVRNSEWRLIPR